MREISFCGGIVVWIWETLKCKCDASCQRAAFHSVSAMKCLFSLSFDSMRGPFFLQGLKSAFCVLCSPNHVRSTAQLISAKAGIFFYLQTTKPGRKTLGNSGRLPKRTSFFFSSPPKVFKACHKEPHVSKW